MAHSTAATLFNLCVPLCVANVFLMVDACTNTCLPYDRHCSTVCTTERQPDKRILLSINWRSITTRSAMANADAMRSQNDEIELNASHCCMVPPANMSARSMSRTTPLSMRHHARLRKPGSKASTIIFPLFHNLITEKECVSQCSFFCDVSTMGCEWAAAPSARPPPTCLALSLRGVGVGVLHR